MRTQLTESTGRSGSPQPQPNAALRRISRVAHGARFGHGVAMFGAALLVTSAAACVFTPPPPLPEELAAERAARADTRLTSFDAKGTAIVPKRPVEPSEGEATGDGAAGGDPALASGEGGESSPGMGAGAQVYEYERGQTAPAGMSRPQMVAYNAAQGDPIAIAIRDGERGDWTLNDGLEGMGGEGELWVVFVTSRGEMECRLHEDLVPNTVGNFIGLARGLRPVLDRDSGEWVKKRYYDGALFHRVIPGFMVQSGDPTGTGYGNPGYVIADELRPELVHDRAGLLSMANRGPGTGSAQFFITLGPTPHLDGLHTIFGECTEASVTIADDISLVPRNEADKPIDPEIIDKVRIERR